jgi:hypothetical protein
VTAVDKIREKVSEIRALADKGDDEAAHSEEDDLYLTVFRIIANGIADDPEALAREVLRTQMIKFARHCG